ncbi:MAG: hypothetical protein FWD05_12625, partial [Oscillospiraceae bacterium]|nr:hypothetical protein [Oscillospiraceae bacterium]
MKKGLIAILTIILLSSFLLSIFLPSLALNELEDEIWIEEDTEVIHENDTDDNSDIDYITPDNGHDSEDNIVPDIEEGHVDTGDAGTDDINTDVNVENDSNTPDSEQDLDERIDDEYL